MNLVYINSRGHPQTIEGNSVAYYTDHNPDFIPNLIEGVRPLGANSFETKVDFSPKDNLLEFLERDMNQFDSFNLLLVSLEEKINENQKKEGFLFSSMGLPNTANSSYSEHLKNVTRINEILRTKRNSELGKAAAALTGANIKIATMGQNTKGFEEQLIKQTYDKEVGRIRNSFTKGIMKTFGAKLTNSLNTKKSIPIEDFRDNIKREERNELTDLNYSSYMNGQLLNNFNVETREDFESRQGDSKFIKTLTPAVIEYFKNYFQLFSVKWTPIKSKVSKYVKEILNENPELANTIGSQFKQKDVVTMFSKLYLKLTVNDLVDVDNIVVGTAVDKKFLKSVKAQKDVNEKGENSILLFDKNDPTRILSKISIGSSGQINKIGKNKRISFSLSEEDKLNDLGIENIDLFQFVNVHIPLSRIFNYEERIENLIMFYLLNFSKFENFLSIDTNMSSFVLVGKDIIPASLVLKNILIYLEELMNNNSKDSPIKINYKNTISQDNFRTIDWDSYPDKKNLKFEYNPNLLNYVNIDLNFNLKTNNIVSKLKKIL